MLKQVREKAKKHKAQTAVQGNRQTAEQAAQAEAQAAQAAQQQVIQAHIKKAVAQAVADDQVKLTRLNLYNELNNKIKIEHYRYVEEKIRSCLELLNKLLNTIEVHESLVTVKQEAINAAVVAHQTVLNKARIYGKKLSIATQQDENVKTQAKNYIDIIVEQAQELSKVDHQRRKCIKS